MTRQEVIQLIKIIEPYFPNFKPDNPQAIVDAWSDAFAEDKGARKA